MSNNETVGYIAYNDQAIWGMGASEAEALEQAEHWLKDAGSLPEETLKEMREGASHLALEADAHSSLEQVMAGLTILPASKLLLEKVEKDGDVAWVEKDGIAVLEEELAETEDA